MEQHYGSGVDLSCQEPVTVVDTEESCVVSVRNSVLYCPGFIYDIYIQQIKLKQSISQFLVPMKEQDNSFLLAKIIL